MRLLTAISIASLVVSIAAVVLVLGLYAELEKSELKAHTQELDQQMVTSVIEQHVEKLIESAGITEESTDAEWDAIPGKGCHWYRSWDDGSGPKGMGFVVWESRSNAHTYNYIETRDIWLVTSVADSYWCKNKEQAAQTWTIDDNTGEITYGRPGD